MQSPDPIIAERQAIQSALLRVGGRLHLNLLARAAALCGYVVLLALITWRVLAWLAGAAPAASALVILLALIAGFGLLLLAGQCLLQGAVDMAHAASEADRRGGLHDELLSALWFMGGDAGCRRAAGPWTGAQLRRAAHTAASLRAPQLVPVRLPRGLLAGLLAGVMVLALAWRAAPLATVQAMPAPAARTGGKADTKVHAMRRQMEALPRTEALRMLEAALRTLESSNASASERQQAMTQAQQAVDQIRLEAAASRAGLHRLSQMLAGQPGMEEVAQALARGDAGRAAELVAQAQMADKGSGNAPVPPDAKGEHPREQAMQMPTDAITEAQGARPEAEPPQMLAERLKEIARQLRAANYVNLAWKEVKGPQMQGGRTGIMAAGRYDEQQAAVDGDPAPGSSATPMGGGTQLRAPILSQGEGTTEQDGGTRMGNATGDGKTDPLLGEDGERLGVQLKQHTLQGQEDAQHNSDLEWSYAESQKRRVQTAWREVNARARYAEAQATAAGGISVKHRRITRDYFVTRPEAAK